MKPFTGEVVKVCSGPKAYSGPAEINNFDPRTLTAPVKVYLIPVGCRHRDYTTTSTSSVKSLGLRPRDSDLRLLYLDRA